jgi:fermentation-respiration switch protein FrsA (DUF1100 family)
MIGLVMALMGTAWRYLCLSLLLVALISLVISRHRRDKKVTVLWSIASIAFLTYVILGLALFFLQSKFLYYPVREVTCSPAGIGLAYEKIDLQTEDNLKITAWFVPAENAEYTILFCHGNAGNLSHRLDSINIFNELGLNCLIFDYRGYGGSQGRPSEKGTYLDVEAAWRWLTDKKNIPPGQIIIFGRSLGGSVAAYLAQGVQAKGLVLESCFTSFVDMGKKFYPYMPVRLFARFRYSTIDYIRRVRCPVMLIHSRDDEIIPFEFGQKLYDAANEPKEFVEIFGTHNEGFLLSGQTYEQAWSEWLIFLAGYEASAPPKLRRSM